MPKEYAEFLQYQLLYLNLPKYGELDPHEFILTVNGEIKTIEQWQLGVDIIYRLLISKLIKVDWAQQPEEKEYLSHIKMYCEVLAKNSPLENNVYLADNNVWLHPYLVAYNKQKLSNLLSKFGFEVPTFGIIQPLNEKFIEELETLFVAHGVGWSNKAIFPVESMGLLTRI